MDTSLQLKTQAGDEIQLPRIVTRNVEVYFIGNILQIQEYSYRFPEFLFTVEVHYCIAINDFGG